MDFFYENQLGKIHFKGGGSGKGGMYVKDISGLGLPEKECNVTVYANRAGQEVISERDIERIITLSVDVYSKNNVQSEVRRLLQMLYFPGVLTVVSGAMNRSIACRCTSVENLQKKGREIRSLILQLTCDCPYFTDKEQQNVTLFSKADLISGHFTLPCVFTERTSRLTIVNQGTISAEPVLKIFSVGTEREETTLAENEIIFINHTTGRQITILYCMTPGEIVTIDVPGRSIISDKNGYIPEVLAPDSFLSEFYLSPGVNDIEVVSYDSGKTLTMSMAYVNHYVEAVV